MKIRAEHIMIIIASAPYIYGMTKMIMELVRYREDKKERKKRCTIPLMVSMTILYSIFVTKTVTVLKYLFQLLKQLDLDVEMFMRRVKTFKDD